MKSKIFFLLALLACGVCGFMGLTQVNAFYVGQDDPRRYEPRTNGVFLGAYYRGSGGIRAGYLGSRSIRATSFRGGGPGAGK